MRGFDTATPLTAELAATFARDGYDFVCRYLVPSASGEKRLTKEEADTISAAGLQIVSVFETTAYRSAAGTDAGNEDGAVALQVAREVGQPEGTTIYFAVDFDAGIDDFDEIEQYLRAAKSQLPGYEVGVYGSFAVVEVLRSRGVVSKFWQTYSWSQGQKSNAASIYQFQNDITVNGIDVDLNESYGNEGWWNTMQVVKLPAAIANNIINSYLAAAWQNCDDHRVQAEKDGDTGAEAAWQQLRDWQHTLANELRKASGQPEE